MKFTKKIFFLSFVAVICLLMLFFKESTTSTYKKGFIQNQPENISISINDRHPGLTIPRSFLGLSYEVTSLLDTVYFRSDNLKFKKLLMNLGDGILRLNGYYANFVPWSSHVRTLAERNGSHSYLTDSVATSDLDSLFVFTQPTGWKIMLGIQFLHSYPARSFSEVNYAWSKGKDIIADFEIGNEPEGAFKSNFTNYYNQLLPYFDLIKSKLPQVPLCGPASVHPELFLAPFINTAYNKVNLITYHEYPVGEDHVANNIDQLLSNKCIDKSNQTASYINRLTEAKNIPYRISECNSYADEGPGITDRFASALWGLDYMFTVAKNNCTGINFHGGSRNFTPIIVKKGQPVAPQPLYYAMLFFHMASDGQLLPVSGLNDNGPVKVYAVKSPSDKILVTLLNKDANNDSDIQLACRSNFTKGSFIRLEGSSVSGKDVTLGGSVIDDKGNWKAANITRILPQNGFFSVKLPKGSATLLTISN